MKKRFAYDDSLDVVGVHGVGGFIGVVMVAFFASESLGGGGYGLGADAGMGGQLKAQLIGGGVTIVYPLVASIAVFWVIDKLGGRRVSDEDEEQGLDLAEHAETGYSL